MHKVRVLTTGIFLVALVSGSAMAASVSLELSGPGVVNESTIKAGKMVSVDMYIENDVVRTGFTLGLSLVSKDIKSVIHVTDTSGGLNENGDIKGYNGFDDKSIWDLFGVKPVERDWDGVLPDLIGFGGVSVRGKYEPTELKKVISIDLIVPESGTLVIDSAFFPPGGKWLFASPQKIAEPETPQWGGPYKITVVK